MINLTNRFFTPKIEDSSREAYKVPVHSNPCIRRNQLPYSDPALKAQAVFFRKLINKGDIKAIDQSLHFFPDAIRDQLKEYVIYADGHPTQEFQRRVEYAFADEWDRRIFDVEKLVNENPDFSRLISEQDLLEREWGRCPDNNSRIEICKKISLIEDQIDMIHKEAWDSMEPPRKFFHLSHDDKLFITHCVFPIIVLYTIIINPKNYFLD